MEIIKRKINTLRSKDQKIKSFFENLNKNTNKKIEKIFSLDKKGISELKELLDLLENKDKNKPIDLIENAKKQLKYIEPIFLGSNDLIPDLGRMTRYGKSHLYIGEELLTKLKILHNISVYLNNVNPVCNL